jgi:hypothetical protein
MLRRFALAALPALFACAPAVTHGPRVEPGASLVMTGGVPRPLCSEFTDCHGGVTPTFGAGVRYGYVPQNPEGAPVMAGVTVPVFDVLAAELDGYVQAPSTGPWAWGGGALVSRRHLMPYLEAGRMPAGGGDGWYLSAGYAHLFRDPSTELGSDPFDDEMVRPPRWFAPGAGARINFRGVRWTVFASGAFGSYVNRTFTPEFIPDGGLVTDTVDTRKNVRTLMVGIAWEVPFRELGRPRIPRPPRRPPPVPQPLPPPIPGPR